MLSLSQCLACSDISPQCLSCSNPVNCSICATGYTSSSCSQCQTGYYASSASPFTCALCTTISPNCLQCTNQTFCPLCAPRWGGSTCSVCAAGYTGLNCADCALGHFSASGICTSCTTISPNCARCADGTTCSLCATGFTGPTCGSCAVGHNGTLCNSCLTGYFMNAGVCVACSTISPRCLTCANGACVQCSTGYQGASCLECDPNYGYTATPFSCTACPTGFASQGGTATCFNTTVPQQVNATSNTTQLASAAGITVSSSLTLAAPPAINSTVLNSFPFNANTFITSKNRLESFRIVQSASAASFQVFFLDHSTSSSVKTLSIDNVSGQWTYLQSSSANLSCIVVRSSALFLALRLDSAAGTFVTHTNISISSVPTAILSTPLTVGENCELLLSGSSIYSLSSSGLTFIRSFSGIKAYSSSLKFIVEGSSLFGYTGSSFASTALAAYS